jgi:hypothetical protein
MGIVIPVCGAITLLVLANTGYTAEYQTLLILAVSGWAIIGLYCGGKLFDEWVRNAARKEPETLNGRERYFEVLNGAYDIQDRLKLLQKDAARNVNRIHALGKEAGFYVKPD